MATGKLIGSSTDGVSTMAGDYVLYAKFTAEATGKVTQIKVYSMVAGNAKISLYADNGGEPGNEITGNDSSQACSVGWNTLTIAETDVVKDTPYWIGVIVDTTGAASYAGLTGIARFKAATFAGFTWPASAGSGFTNTTAYMSLAAWGVLVISPPGLSQPIAYGTPKLSLRIKPPGHQQVIAYGTPTISTAGIVISPPGIAVIISYGTPEVQVGEPPLFIYPPGLQVVIAYGTPSLRYPQTISPPGLNVPLAYGTPTILVAGEGVIFVPGHQQVIGYGVPTILKYVWHVILDGQYHIESPEINRAYVIGRDVNGNPVWGEAQDSTELGLVGERLDFQPDPAIPTQAQAGDVAAAMLSKMRLGKKRGVILIPYNCGQELWDVVQISDAGANQQAVSFRVVGIRFEYHPKQARYEHKLLLGAP
jgi:hypothetical protein